MRAASTGARAAQTPNGSFASEEGLTETGRKGETYNLIPTRPPDFTILQPQSMPPSPETMLYYDIIYNELL